MFTESRNAGSVNIALGPTISGQIRAGPLPSLEEEIIIVNRKVDIGQNPEVLAPRLERILFNSGMPEELSPGKDVLLSRECAISSKDISELSQKLRNADDVKFSARMENLLGNVIWLNDPVLSSKRAVDSAKSKNEAARKSETVLEHYERALAADKGYLPALKNQAVVLHLVGRDMDAIESCKEYIDRKIDDPDIWELQGKAHMELANHQDALRCFDSALKLSSKNHELWFNKGLALMEIQRYQEAMACFDRSIKLEPHNPEALNSRGDALTKMGKIDLAVESYDKANNMMQRPAFISKQIPADIVAEEKITENSSQVSTDISEIFAAAESEEPEITPKAGAMQEDMEDEPELPDTEIEKELEILELGEEDDFPPDMMEKEPEEIDMEAELEVALDIQNEAELTETITAMDSKESAASSISENEVKKPKSLAEMFMNGLDMEEEKNDSEWPELPEVIDLPDNGNEEDEPVLAPLMGIPVKQTIVPTDSQESEEHEEKIDIEEKQNLPDDIEISDIMSEIPEPDEEISAEEEGLISEIEEIEIEQQLDEALASSGLNNIHNLIDDEEYITALARTREMLEKDPRNTEILALKGGILISLDRAEDGLAEIQKAIGIDKNNITAWLNQGHAYYNLDVYDKSINAYDEAIKIEPKNIEAWHGMGLCHLQNEDYEEAIVSFNEIVEVEPENTDAWLGIGDAFLGLEREDDAFKCYEKVTALDQEEPEGWAKQGNILVLKGRWGGSLQMFDRAIKIDDEYVYAYLRKARVYMNRNMLDQADEVYKKLLEVYPTEPEGLAGRVEIQIKRGKWGAALQSLRAVLKHHPDFSKAWALQGDIYREEGRVAEAKKPYDTALALNPNDVTALTGKGQLMLDNGDYNEAISLFRKALDVDSEKAHIWRYLGEAQKEIGKEGESIKSLEMAVDLGEHIADNWMAYGISLHEVARYSEAIESFDKALKISPKLEGASRWREQSAKRLIKEVE